MDSPKWRASSGLVSSTNRRSTKRTAPPFARTAGVGMEEGLGILAEVRQTYSCPVLTDVHSPEQCAPTAEAVDVLQIPAFFVPSNRPAGRRCTNRQATQHQKGTVPRALGHEERGPEVRRFGQSRRHGGERGVSFGYNTLVSDMRSLPILAETGRRWCSMPRIRCSNLVGRALPAAASGALYRCWRVRRSRSGLPPSSWRRMKIRIVRLRMVQHGAIQGSAGASFGHWLRFDRIAKAAGLVAMAARIKSPIGDHRPAVPDEKRTIVTAILDMVAARIYDSRGNPTVEVEVMLGVGGIGRAAVPSGASTGQHEADELRDGDKQRYSGKGVLKARQSVKGRISQASRHGADDQLASIETMIELDGTPTRPPRRQCHPRRYRLAVAKAAQQRAAALSLPRRCSRHAAGADDEHHQRRRACGQQRRLPGIHDHAGRRRDLLPRRCAWRGSFPSLKAVLHEKRLQHRRRR